MPSGETSRQLTVSFANTSHAYLHYLGSERNPQNNTNQNPRRQLFLTRIVQTATFRLSCTSCTVKQMEPQSDILLIGLARITTFREPPLDLKAAYISTKTVPLLTPLVHFAC